MWVFFETASPLAVQKVHDVFHVSLLKKKWHSEGNEEVIEGLSGFLLREDPAVVYPEKILERKGMRKGQFTVTMWLVKWKGKVVEDASWEPAQEILIRFPEFDVNSGGQE